MKQKIYKIKFFQVGEVYEIFAKNIHQSDFYAFLEIEDYIFDTKNKPASLYRALGGFAENNINLTRLESFFVNKEFKQFSFLIDVESHPKNKPFLKIRNGRESVKFDNLEFSRIFMAWFIPNLNDQKNIIGLEILASILSVGRNSRLVKILKEDSNLVESVYVDVNAGELGGLFIMEASCESKDIDLVEKQINKTIDEISNCKVLALDEIKKAINIVKSNYIFNLETSTQLSSFFGNELLWGRKSSINNLESHLKYWNDLDNFKEITEYIRGEKFTLVASPGKC